MDTDNPLLRKPLPAQPSQTSPNTAFKRKPIPVAVTPPTPVDPPHGQQLELPCPHCGAAGTPKTNGANEILQHGVTDLDAQRRISELEAEVKILTGKATAAADKLADYEDELEKLKTKQARSEDIDRLNAIRARSPSPRPPTLDSPSPDAKRTSALSVAEKEEMAEEESDTVSSLPPAPAPQQSETRRPSGGLGRSLTTTRITNFLNARRTSPVAKVTAPGSESPGTPAGEVDLASRLNEAESARRAAETKLTQTNQELEELSASLFQSANEMVSNERRANAEREAEAEKKAKEREEQWQQWQEQVKANDRAAAARSRSLEKKVRRLEERVRMLEEREKEKAKRLERLEMAMKRTARVRSLLQPQGQTRPYSNLE